MHRPARLPIALAAADLCTVSGLSAGPVASIASAASCTTTPSSLAGGYILPGKNKGVSCANRKGLEVGYQACRLKTGPKGLCKTKVLGFACKEGKRQGASVAGHQLNFFAVVSCKKGSQSFGWTYQQNLS